MLQLQNNYLMSYSYIKTHIPNSIWIKNSIIMSHSSYYHLKIILKSMLMDFKPRNIYLISFIEWWLEILLQFFYNAIIFFCEVDQGLRLYNQHKQQQAVRKWKSALKAIRKREDKFSLLGYLYQAYIDWGKYRDALEYAHRQLFISEELDSPNLRAESYLNLAKAHQRLGGLER